MPWHSAFMSAKIRPIPPQKKERPHMVEITAVHMSGGTKHEHIAEVKWKNPETSETGKSTRETMVDWIENKSGKAYVTDGKNKAWVGVVNATPKYIRTHADGKWSDNLLSLPRY